MRPCRPGIGTYRKKGMSRASTLPNSPSVARPSLRFMRDESGVALVIVLGVMMVMTISAVGLLSYSVSNEHSQRYGALNDRSLDLAEAGANSALSVLANAADPTNPSTLPPSAIVVQ